MAERIWGLAAVPAAERTDLLAAPVAAGLEDWKAVAAERPPLVAEVDPELSDTAAASEAYGFPMEAGANCIVVTGKRGGEVRTAACVVLATTRLDVNGAVRRRLDVRKASFARQDDAVAATGMEYGGITPVGLPEGWPLLVDAAVAACPLVVVGSGVRRSKLIVPGAALAGLPGAETVDGLGLPLES
ncbi:YbaK/EbsC family protein [Nocardiopsis composta]|uniref:Prolyl-tRNA editing enzyme YbaK/EbsC (Cys-tRNA(Pro) deacylase) n=1 Tax=Nocardiopsis composta TaxID=157465 RepID=A0A7W8QM98_9ACTN|nr:YbaK/EbsC family protein [Nocardiopsis composta]MBB5432599.1 prolyl-tRNA editing enzyme YbaK/EbsC (Cys-tRNA(Pro) deacylase) [Nocardiopsis composta]